MKIIFTFIMLIGIAYGQSTVYLRADSIKIMKQNGNANLQILNATRDSTNGVLINIGNGITKFQRIRAINDSQFTVGTDTISMAGGGGSSDPVAFLRNPTIAGYAILDFSSYVDTVYGKRLLPGFGWYADTTALTITGKVDTNNITSRLDRMKLRDSILSIVLGNNGLTETANVIQLGGALIQNTTITPSTFELNFAGNGLGVSQTETSGIRLTNTTAATVGAQQISPAIYMLANGWKTNATAASRSIEVRNYIIPVQGAAEPTIRMLWDYSLGGSAYATLMEVTSTGLQHIGSGNGGGISLSASAPVSGRLTTVSGLTITNSSTADDQTNKITNSTGYQQTSGHTSTLYISNGSISNGFYPTSGTADHDVFEINGYINQTGSATGITRGVHLSIDYIAGPDYRAIQVDEGAIWLNNTITAIGTTGNQTINKASGTVNIAGGGTAATVTNSWVTATSIVYCVVRTNDATAYIRNVVPAAGSFTVTLGAAATGTVSIGFVVFNPGTTTL